MRVVELIRRKRDGQELAGEEIHALISGYTRGDIPDYQMSAWLMAVVLKGMTKLELAALTEAMLRSGDVLDLSSIPGKKVDKHSTGGVGDKTSLVIAPLVAAAGLTVPMISGRGLGHTGGTLDKLEAIPDFNVNLSLTHFRRTLEKIGVAMIGQTAEIAPADKKIYALRDVTGTVESPFLICASIMSKKLAESMDALVLDVKVGSGAFMKKHDDAAYLAQLMVETGERMGKRVVALLTDMDQPLGEKIGNALEVEECVELMRGAGPADLRFLCIELSAWMIFLGGASPSVAEGRKLAEKTISSGAALERFRQMIDLQGGDPKIIDDFKRLPQAKNTVDIKSPSAGYIQSMQCEQVGIASVVLGGGREKKEDSVDPAVGLVLHKKVGDPVERGESLCTVYYNSDARLDEARKLLESAYRFAPSAPTAGLALVRKVIGAEAH